MELNKKATPQKRKINIQPIYLYSGFFKTHIGVRGDELDQKLEARELARKTCKMKWKERWERIFR